MFVVVILGGYSSFFAGIHVGWSSPVIAKLNGTEDNPTGELISSEDAALIGSLFGIGGAVGQILIIYTLEVFGRKTTLIVITLPFLIFTLVFTYAKTYLLYEIGRFFVGLATGASYTIVPIYIGEVSPAHLRGSYISLSNTLIMTGLLFTFVLGPYTSIFYFNMLSTILVLIYIPLLILICPESPYYTMQKKKTSETLEILQKLRRNNNEHEEVEEIATMVENNVEGSYLDIFKDPVGFKVFVIVTTLLIIQQLTGMIFILSYCEVLFKGTNIKLSSDIVSIIFGAIQFLSGFIFPLIGDKFKRKTLFYVSLSGIVAFNLYFTVYFYKSDFLENWSLLRSWLSISVLVLYVTFFNSGIGPLPWIYLGELYPLHIKSVGSSLSTCIFMLVQFGITYFFEKIEASTFFLFFTISSLLGIVFVKYFVVETKGKTLQEVQNTVQAS